MTRIAVFFPVTISPWRPQSLQTANAARGPRRPRLQEYLKGYRPPPPQDPGGCRDEDLRAEIALELDRIPPLVAEAQPT